MKGKRHILMLVCVLLLGSFFCLFSGSRKAGRTERDADGNIVILDDKLVLPDMSPEAQLRRLRESGRTEEQIRQAEEKLGLTPSSASSEEERPWSSKAGISNFAAFDGYFVVEILDPGASGITLGWIEREEGKDAYTLEDVQPYPFGQVERATCFEAYEKDGEDYLFTRAGFYKVSKGGVEELRAFPTQRYSRVQYDHSLGAFLYVDLQDRSLYLSPLEGESRCICQGRFIEEGSSQQGKDMHNPDLLAYPIESRLSGQRILYWYFHADGKRTLRVCDLEGNLLSETDGGDQYPFSFHPDWLGSGFAGEDTFLLWWMERSVDENRNYRYTTHLTLYDQNFQALREMEIPYGIDTFLPPYRGEEGTVYFVGGSSHEGATEIKSHLIELRPDEGTYRVLAEDEFIDQVSAAEDGLYYLNAKDVIQKIG